jgi:hypothetical protein
MDYLGVHAQLNSFELKFARWQARQAQLRQRFVRKHILRQKIVKQRGPAAAASEAAETP